MTKDQIFQYEMSFFFAQGRRINEMQVKPMLTSLRELGKLYNSITSEFVLCSDSVCRFNHEKKKRCRERYESAWQFYRKHVNFFTTCVNGSHGCI